MLAFLDKEDALAGCRLLGCRLYGEGGYGRVYRVPLQDDLVVAIKCFRDPFLNDYLGQKYYWYFESLGFIRHRNLVQLLAYVFRANSNFLVYEFVPGGSLQDALNQMAARKLTLSWPQRHRILCGVARGLASLHDGSLGSSFLHRNLKPTNILLDEGYEAKIGDFSLAAIMALEGTHRVPAVFFGTDGFVSPECILGGR
jgi:serine/threonine protein kinase